MTMIVFETFECPAFFASTTAPLALAASGRTTGLVVDSGHRLTNVVPVYEGFPLHYATERFGVAGKDVSDFLRTLLLCNKPGQITRATNEEIIRGIKERFCYVAPDFCAAVKLPEAKENSYVLPDGQTVQVDDECFRAPEPMFTPLLGLHTAVGRSMAKVPSHLKVELFKSIALVWYPRPIVPST